MLRAVLEALRPEELRTHLVFVLIIFVNIHALTTSYQEYLSDDLMEGRGTGSRGEARICWFP